MLQPCWPVSLAHQLKLQRAPPPLPLRRCCRTGDKAASATASTRAAAAAAAATGDAAAGAAGEVRARLDSSIDALKGWLAWGGAVSKETQERTGGAFDQLRWGPGPPPPPPPLLQQLAPAQGAGSKLVGLGCCGCGWGRLIISRPAHELAAATG
jgi:hypothetical protein